MRRIGGYLGIGLAVLTAQAAPAASPPNLATPAEPASVSPATNASASAGAAKVEVLDIPLADVRWQMHYRPEGERFAPNTDSRGDTSTLGVRVDATALDGRIRARATYDPDGVGGGVVNPQVALDYRVLSKQVPVLDRSLRFDADIRQQLELPSDDGRVLTGSRSDNAMTVRGRYAGIALTARHLWSTHDRGAESTALSQASRGFESELRWPLAWTLTLLPETAALPKPTLRYRSRRVTVDYWKATDGDHPQRTERHSEDAIGFDLSGGAWQLGYEATHASAEDVADGKDLGATLTHAVQLVLKSLPVIGASLDLGWKEALSDSGTVRNRTRAQLRWPLGISSLPPGHFVIDHAVETSELDRPIGGNDRQQTWSVACRVELDLP